MRYVFDCGNHKETIFLKSDENIMDKVRDVLEKNRFVVDGPPRLYEIKRVIDIPDVVESWKAAFFKKEKEDQLKETEERERKTLAELKAKYEK